MNRYRGILTRIVQWSTLSANDCFREVKQTASSIRGVERLSSGSLVLIKVPEDLKIKSLEEEKWVYARVAGKADGSLILVYLDPHESNVSSFPYDRVIPVPTELLQKHFLKDNHTEVCFLSQFSPPPPPSPFLSLSYSSFHFSLSFPYSPIAPFK